MRSKAAQTGRSFKTSAWTVLILLSNTWIRRSDRQFTICAIKAKRSSVSSGGSRVAGGWGASLGDGRKSPGLCSMMSTADLMYRVAGATSEDARKFAPTIKWACARLNTSLTSIPDSASASCLPNSVSRLVSDRSPEIRRYVRHP